MKNTFITEDSGTDIKAEEDATRQLAVSSLSRRKMIGSSLRAGAALTLGTSTLGSLYACSESSDTRTMGKESETKTSAKVLTQKEGQTDHWFKVSLAQWSLHRQFLQKKSPTTDFAKLAKEEFNINAIEYVNQFYADTYSQALINELKKQSEDYGVRNVLIMVDQEGNLGASAAKERKQAIEKHKRWADMAHQLGCHSLRVNAYGDGDYKEQALQAAEGLNGLSDYCKPLGLSVCVENHGDLSSNGEWLAAVMQLADNPNVGTLPDFGNFVTNYETKEEFDKYKGVKLLMPYAKGVSAKVFNFNDKGMEADIDYDRMFTMIKQVGYSGYIGIEYEGENNGLTEFEGIHKTRDLLLRMRAKYA